jgi:hypothetical protein
MGIDRKKELRMLLTPRANMFMLACTGLPWAVIKDGLVFTTDIENTLFLFLYLTNLLINFCYHESGTQFPGFLLPYWVSC